MSKLATTAAAFAILSLGSFVADRPAQAGGAMSAPVRIKQVAATDHYQVRHAHTVRSEITEFSSSSARSSVPRR